MKIKAYARLARDNSPAHYPTVLAWAVQKIQQASVAGKGVRLTPEEVRALDYAVIREDGGVPTDCFRDHSFTGNRP